VALLRLGGLAASVTVVFVIVASTVRRCGSPRPGRRRGDGQRRDPGVFAPVEVGGRRLMDGGVSDNTPISHAIELAAVETAPR
jgi:hypothetical protein